MQTSINPAGQPVGVAGMDYDSGEGKDVVSFFVEGSDSIPFGCGVAQGTAEKGGRAIAATTDKVIGINVFGYNHAPNDLSGTGDLDDVGLKPNRGGQLGRRGRWLVPIAKGVTVHTNDRAFVLGESDGGDNTLPGVWSNAQAGGHYIDLTAVGVFRSEMFVAPNATGASANVAVLEVAFTNKP